MSLSVNSVSMMAEVSLCTMDREIPHLPRVLPPTFSNKSNVLADQSRIKQTHKRGQENSDTELQGEHHLVSGIALGQRRPASVEHCRCSCEHESQECHGFEVQPHTQTSQRDFFFFDDWERTAGQEKHVRRHCGKHRSVVTNPRDKHYKCIRLDRTTTGRTETQLRELKESTVSTF